MKTFIILLITLFAANAYAARIDCTTRFVNVKAGKPPTAKICGAVSVERASDNGVKYRKQPRSCQNLQVELFSIRKGNDARFTRFCDTIQAKNCYMIGIHDTESHQGIDGLSSFIVFPSITAVPAVFNLNASRTGHHAGPTVELGRLVRLDLACRQGSNESKGLA